MDDTLDLEVAPDQRVDLAFFGGGVEVVSVLLQRRGFFVALAAFFVALVVAGAVVFLFGGVITVAIFADAVGDEVDHIQPRNALLVQVVQGVRVFFAKNGHQHIGAGDFFLAITRALHMHDGALNHALKAQRGLGVDLFGAGQGGVVFFDEIAQPRAQVVDMGRAGLEHLGGRRVIQQRQQQVLGRDEFVALLPGLDKGHVQGYFQFLGNHVKSFLS